MTIAVLTNAVPIRPAKTIHGGTGVPRTRLSTPSSRMLVRPIARPTNDAETTASAMNAGTCSVEMRTLPYSGPGARVAEDRDEHREEDDRQDRREEERRRIADEDLQVGAQLDEGAAGVGHGSPASAASADSTSSR